jgi:hypothetical protein
MKISADLVQKVIALEKAAAEGDTVFGGAVSAGILTTWQKAMNEADAVIIDAACELTESARESADVEREVCLARNWLVRPGYALIAFEFFKEAQSAIHTLHGHLLHEKAMTVDWAFKPAPNNARGGGGGANRARGPRVSGGGGGGRGPRDTGGRGPVSRE